MDSKKKLMMVALVIGALLLVGAWVFLLRTMLGTNDDTMLQADIQQDQIPDTGDSLTNDTPDDDLQNNTDTVVTGSTTSGKTVVPEDEPLVFTSISLILPPIIDQRSVQDTAEQIEKEYGVPTQRIQYDTMETYQQALKVQLRRQQGIDIAVVPTSRAQSFSGRGYRIPFQTSISSLFDYRFKKLVDHKEFSYIPILMDPAVSMIHQAQARRTDYITISKINSILSRPRETDSFYVPILFGIDQILRGEIESNRYTFYQQQFLLEVFLDLAIKLEKSGYLSFFIDLPQRDAEQVQLVADQLGEGDPGCELHPLLCMMSYQYSDVYLGLLSDWRLLQQQFPTQHEHVRVLNFPAPTEHYPIQGWGLIINKHSPDLQSSLQRSKGYFNLLLERELDPWNIDLIAADNETRQRQLLETRFLTLRNYIKQGVLLEGEMGDLQAYTEETPLLETLAGDYNINIFINSLAD